MQRFDKYQEQYPVEYVQRPHLLDEALDNVKAVPEEVLAPVIPLFGTELKRETDQEMARVDVPVSTPAPLAADGTDTAVAQVRNYIDALYEDMQEAA